MIKKYILLIVVTVSFAVIYACSNDADDNYTPISPVSVDLTQVPYPKLSDYKFFEGTLKDLSPALGVLPYEPAASLFADYAHKKRFVWMPKGTKATYTGDDKTLELPVGAVLIKTFYYEKVQNTVPVGATLLVETRLMIRKSMGWIFADYIWNDDQTEAFLDLNGSYKTITWLDENNTPKTVDYRIPSEVQCITCHKSEQTVDNVLITTHLPIGIKPQNLNRTYAYASGTKNELLKWMEVGYLENFNLPSTQNTTIDYTDATQPIALRARSYVDINCAHCHNDQGHCGYRPLRYAYNETFNNATNMGVCVPTQDMQGFPATLAKIVTPGNINKSMMYYRLNTTDESYRMPLHGRTIIHEEGIALIEDWINSLPPCQ